MTTTTEHLISTFYRAFAGDAELLTTVVSPDWRDIPLAPGQDPGPDGAVPIIQGLSQAVSDFEIVIHDVVDGRGPDGSGTVAARCEMRGRHTGELMGLPPTGDDVSIALHEFHEIVDDRIHTTWHLEDWFGLFNRARGH